MVQLLCKTDRMNVIATSHITAFETPQPLLSHCVRQKLQSGWKWCVRLLNKHTDLISSVGILSITTCLLAAKIFKSIPVLLPRIARVVFDYGGIIWLNLQVRDCLKSCRDLGRAIEGRELKAVVETAGKVVVKASSILLTCVTFAASVVALVGFPQVTTAMYLAMRPIGLTSLAMTIAGDVNDYFVNAKLLKKLDALDARPEASLQVTQVMNCFLEIVLRPKEKYVRQQWVGEARLADRIVRQLDTFTLESFCEGLKKKRESADLHQEALKVFESVKQSMRKQQVLTKANLSLTALGYVSLGLSRAFPDSLLDMSSRWGMSLLYTCKLIWQKTFQANVTQVI